jgi:hypothetical protein
MEKMLFTTNDLGRLKRTAVKIFKIGDDFLDSFQITMFLVKYQLDFEETVEETIKMIIKGVASSVSITRTTPAPVDKIMDQGFRDLMSRLRTS